MTDDIRANAQHLLHLLNMLPNRSDTEFWEELDHAENGGRSDGYFLGKMGVVHRMLRQQIAKEQLGPEQVLYLAQYILMFFDRDNPRMWKVLDHAANLDVGSEGRIGRRWAEDACRTAGALYSYGWGSTRDDEHPELTPEELEDERG